MKTNLAFDNLHIFGEEKIFSVSELSFAIKGAVERHFASIKLRGEISGLKTHTSGHTYFSLKDDTSLINAICWRGTKVGFKLEEGMEVVVTGKVTSYPARSQYQLIVEEATIAGEGALLKLLNERKKHFAALGYFDKKQRLPKYPKIIGIVTSKTGAVLQDMRHRLEDRYPFCHVVVWPTNVQGTGAADQVAQAIRGFNFMLEKRPDVLIVARGGGSIEDLWAFNEEVVIKAVYDSRIPIISAIGHETDTTLIDYASDLRAPTPTAAIELATPVLSEIREVLSGSGIRISSATSRIIRELSSRVQMCNKSLSSSQFAIINISQKFDDKVEMFENAIFSFLQKENLKLKTKKLMQLDSYINLKKHQYSSVNKRLERASDVYLQTIHEKIKSLFVRLEQSSFMKILGKGFCFITNAKGETINTKKEFCTQNRAGISLHFVDGEVSLD